MAEVKFDVAALDKAFNAALNKAKGKEVKEASPAKMTALEAFPSAKANLANLGIFDDVQQKFCPAWPKISATLRWGLSIIKWFIPATAYAMAIAGLDTVDGLVAQICGPAVGGVRGVPSGR